VKNLVFLAGFAIGLGLVRWLGQPPLRRLETDEERMLRLGENPWTLRLIR
jgi:hypothetical protein